MSQRDPFAGFRARLEAVGFQPSSTLGQNFLLDPSLHRWLAEQAEVGPLDTVVEIGVGLGFLTRELAQRAGQVVGIEIDARLFAVASAELASCANVELVAGDALGGPGRSLHPRVAEAATAAAARGGGFAIVANLPYAVSGPLLAEMVALPVWPRRAVLLVQKEMAQRVAAPVGSPDYGGLSVLVQAAFAVRLLRDVSPQVFRPRPKVVSAVLQLDRRDAAPLATAAPAERRQFAAFVRRLFQQRRKVLRHTLAAACAEVGLVAHPDWSGELLGRRAEQLAPPQIQELWQAARDAAAGGA